MKILITDDHAVVRQGYATLLGSVLDAQVEVLEAGSGDQALSLFWERRPEVTVLDVNLPGISGIEVARRICQRDYQARILMFSMHDEIPLVDQAMEVGASGYITKSCAPEVLIEAVKKVAGGQLYIEHELAQQLAFRQPRGLPGRLSQITRREFEVFVMLAQGMTVNSIDRKSVV